MSYFGLMNVAKPSGVTSRRVVDQVQRLVRPAKVGHAGTLDPLASGVLVIGVGHATRLVEFVQEMPKKYRGTFLLGRTSATEDTDGEVTLLTDPPIPTLAELEQAAAELTGETEQRPPVYSALKVDGRRAYALARAGEQVDLAPRTIRVDSLKIVHYEYPELRLDVTCGSGTYVRSLGRDLAEHCGTCAVMSALERTAIGPFELSAALDPDKLSRDNIAGSILPASLAVQGLMAECVVSAADEQRLRHGLWIEAPHITPPRATPWARPIQGEPAADAPIAALDATGRLVAVLTRRPNGYAPAKFFSRD